VSSTTRETDVERIMDERTDRQKDKWTEGQTEAKVDERTDRLTDGGCSERKDGKTDRTDRQNEWQTDRSINGCKNRQTDG
jgi:hypothetical protein